MKKGIRLILAYALVLFCIPAGFAFAVQQEIVVTVKPDFSASGVWKLPVSGQDGSIYEFSNLEDFGATGIMDYTLRTIANSEGDLPLDRSGAGIIVNNTYKDGSHGGINDLFVTYDIKTALTKPVAIYEVWVAGGAYFNSPIVTVNYPKDWKVSAVYPPAKSQDNGSIVVEYPTDTAYVTPVLVVFLPSDPGAGNIVKQTGRFTLAGDKASVKKLEQAVAKMTYIDDVLRDSAGLSAPSSMLLYAGDLRSVDVGYEAEALAARPNVVLYNRDILANQTQEKVQTVLLHEIAHLSEASLKLFKGATYIAPWFREGLAVFVENQARPLIYKDSNKQAVADAFGDSHIFTPGTLKERYLYHYDYLYNGDNTTPIAESYTLSGVTMKHLYNTVGVAGIQKVFDSLKNASSNQVVWTADSDKIMSAMTTATGLTRGDLEFPYEFDKEQESKVVSLTRPEYSDSEMQAIANAINKEVPNYLSGASSAAVPEPAEEEPAKPEEKPIEESVMNAVTSLFGFGKSNDTKEEDVKKEETARTEAGTSTATGTADVAEVAPEEIKSKSFIDSIIDFFRSIFGW